MDGASPEVRSSPLKSTSTRSAKSSLSKAPSGVDGLDAITFGGLPKGRPTLVYGGPGCGKTLLGIQFLTRGASEFDEPGVFLSFEETIEEHKQNVKALGYDLTGLIRRNLLMFEHAMIDPSREIGRGEYDLDALFMRLARAVDQANAKRVVIDALETVILGERDRAAVRQSFERLFRWLKNRQITSVITAEDDGHGRSRHGFEDYIADCVVHLDHRIVHQVSTRTLRVVKYRGSGHSANEYPFLIDENGIHVAPLSAAGLQHPVSTDRASTGIPRLDAMLGGAGYYRGTTALISGTPGAGKSSLAAHYMDAACARGEHVLVFSYEESPDQTMRNMGSIGFDLKRWVNADALQFLAARPSMYGLEMHLAVMTKAITRFGPQSVVIDPISNLVRAGNEDEAQSVVVRLIDFLKTRGITTILTHPTTDISATTHSNLAISSIVDTWILLETVQSGGERNRQLFILKSRGMAHSNQVREFHITSRGVELVDVYDGPQGVLTGAARATREAEERAARLTRAQEVERQRRNMVRRQQAIEAQIAALQADLEAELAESARVIGESEELEQQLSNERAAMARHRRADQGTR
jgi:circadian clock protein KaiC